MRKNRGYCGKCHKRTSHQIEDVYICIGCEGNMALEDDVISAEEEQILKTVNTRGLSAKELQLVLRQARPSKNSQRTYDHSVAGHVRIGIISDTHIGQEMFDEGALKHAGETFRKLKIENVYHVGDILEGMSGRDGQIYELNQIGFSEQIKEAERLFKKHLHGFDVHGIIGNHDLWFYKKNNGGVDVGEELSARVPNFHYLGQNEADVKLGKGVIMKMFHPGDGSAYAYSYKAQKMIESLEGERKPQIFVEGHYHKAMYMFLRNVHVYEAGTLCGQTEWMRGKKISVHKGYWVIDFDIAKGKKGGVKTIQSTFYPFYS